MRPTHQPFIVCHDYGQGGLWAIVEAESADQIENTFQDLVVIHDRPEWLNEKEYARLERVSIDNYAASSFLVRFAKRDS